MRRKRRRRRKFIECGRWSGGTVSELIFSVENILRRFDYVHSEIHKFAKLNERILWLGGYRAVFFLVTVQKLSEKRENTAQKVFNKLWKLKFPEINGHFYDLSSPAFPNKKFCPEEK